MVVLVIYFLHVELEIRRYILILLDTRASSKFRKKSRSACDVKLKSFLQVELLQSGGVYGEIGLRATDPSVYTVFAPLFREN